MDAKEYGQKSWPTEPQWPELFANLPEPMPADFYPQEFYIQGKHGPYELACVVPMKDGKVDMEALVMVVKGLRLSFWYALEEARLENSSNKER